MCTDYTVITSTAGEEDATSDDATAIALKQKTDALMLYVRACFEILTVAFNDNWGNRDYFLAEGRFGMLAKGLRLSGVLAHPVHGLTLFGFVVFLAPKA